MYFGNISKQKIKILQLLPEIFPDSGLKMLIQPLGTYIKWSFQSLFSISIIHFRSLHSFKVLLFLHHYIFVNCILPVKEKFLTFKKSLNLNIRNI